MGGFTKPFVVGAVAAASLVALLSAPASAAEYVYDPTVAEVMVVDNPQSTDFGQFWATWPATAGQLLSDGAVAANPDYAQWPRLDGVPVDYGMARWDDLNPFEWNTWPRSHLWLQANWNAAPGVDVTAAMTEVANCVAAAEVEKIYSMISNEAADRALNQAASQAEYDALSAESFARYEATEKIGLACVEMAERYFPNNIYRAPDNTGPEFYDTWAVGAERFDMGGMPASAIGADGVEYQYQIHGLGYVSELPESNEATMTLVRWNCAQTINLEEIYASVGLANANNAGATEGLDLCTDGLTVTTFSQTVDADPALREVQAPKTEREKLMRSMGPFGFLIPWMDPTTFSELAPYEGWQAEAPRLATAGGLALAFTALAAIPSQLLSSTLTENRALFDRLFRVKRRTPKAASESEVDTEAAPKGESRPRAKGEKLPARFWWQRILKPRGFFAFLLFLVTPFIAAYSQPDFALDLNHMRIVLWLLLGYVVVNLMSTMVGRWFAGPKRRLFAIRASARLDFLVILAVTVAFTRVTGVMPAIVFGAVLALDLIRTGGSDDQERRMSARMTLGATLYVFVIGLAAWVGFSKYPPFFDVFVFPGIDGPVKELLAVIAVEALTTAPLMLLPIAFLPGQQLWRRSKVLWGVTYVVAVSLFLLVVVRMPQSWSALPASAMTAWTIGLVAYAIFALAVWFGFRFATKRLTQAS